jgi:opacity protein-like surface antigen
MLGGGVMNFTGASARSVTQAGGAWDLRLGWGTRRLLGMEAAYIGSLNKMSAAGLDPDAMLLGTGVEGALRLNIPVAYRTSMIEPFGLAGLGWTRFDLINEDFNASAVNEKDHILTVPVGAGVAIAVNGLMIDARYTYRFAYRENLIGNTNLDNWIVSANIGSEF